MLRFIFLSVLTVVSCGHLKEKQVPGELSFIVKENGRSQKITVPLEFQNGLAILFSNDIDQQLNTPKVVRTPFSYVAPRKVEIEIPGCENISGIIFSSFKIKDCKLEEKELTNYVIGIADPKHWKIENAKTKNTTFQLVTTKKSKIPVEHWKNSVERIWKEFNVLFGEATDIVTFIELDWAPISGGPLGENVLGIFYQENVSAEAQDELLHDLGWKSHRSTLDYVSKYYQESSSPWEDYLVGTYAHELAHIYFGFGVTRERVKEAHELWFSLGMGLLYDTEVTEKLTKQFPALFSYSEAILEKYARNNEIDQRLVKPATLNDQKHNLDRKKVYAHSKAFQFLGALRKNLGRETFDKATFKYLQDCRSCENGYEDFKKFIPLEKLDRVRKIETMFRVYR